MAEPPNGVGTPGKHYYSMWQTLFEVDTKYVPNKPIGRGAYGIVRSSVNRETNEKVAIKKINNAIENRINALRTLRELKLLWHLRHENVIALIDVMMPIQRRSFKDVHLVYELMDTDLHQIIKSSQALSNDHCQYFLFQAFEGHYLDQVTIDNNHPLGRLDQWNLTWEWMRGEFIYSMRGAYNHKKDYADCLYSASGAYYKDVDFTAVMNCQKKPVIADLPPDRAKDEKVGNLPYCCKNSTLLPTTMDESKARSVFQLEVYKIPPDMNRTALLPPKNWKINGILNPDYRCGAPITIDSTEFPDPSGLQVTSTAIASWQIICNITRPKKKDSHCCVSFSAYYNDSVIPCKTCACGCDDTVNCNQDAQALLLPS